MSSELNQQVIDNLANLANRVESEQFSDSHPETVLELLLTLLNFDGNNRISFSDSPDCFDLYRIKDRGGQISFELRKQSAT